jgi:LacI family sucrose operon transcriptional repressor
MYLFICIWYDENVRKGDFTMVTINDIARLAGVAKSTVSRYLNGGSVSAKTKEKLDRIIAETEYTPNAFAQSLKSKKPSMIGIIIPRLNSYATNEILSSIDEELRNKQYQLLITNTNQDIEREIENINTLSRQKVAGIIILATVITPAHMKAIRSSGLPVIFLGQKAKDSYSIVHDEIEAGRNIGHHAAELGHKKILYVTVFEDDVAVGQLRKKGVLDALSEYKDIEVKVITSDFNYQKAYEQALMYLPKSDATYCICATDNIALAVYKAAVTLGKKVPSDISISGFGGYDITNLVTPSITTVKYHYKEMGRIAVENMIRLIEGEEVLKCITLGNEFQPKESTAKL